MPRALVKKQSDHPKRWGETKKLVEKYAMECKDHHALRQKLYGLGYSKSYTSSLLKRLKAASCMGSLSKLDKITPPDGAASLSSALEMDS